MSLKKNLPFMSLFVFPLILPSVASAYYYDLSSWWYWYTVGDSQTLSAPAAVPTSIHGNYYGDLKYTHPPANNPGDGGNMYLPLAGTSMTPGDTYQLSFDVLSLHADNAFDYILYMQGFGTWNGTYMRADGYSQGIYTGIADGTWHHVDITLTLPQGFHLLNTANGLPPGFYDFSSITLGSLRPLSSTVVMGTGQYDHVFLDNFSLLDVTTPGSDFIGNGSFDTFTGNHDANAFPTGYTVSPTVSGGLGTTLIVDLVPEPMSMTFLGLGGTVLFAARRRKTPGS